MEKNMLLEKSFQEDQLSFEVDGIKYQSIRARKIIFCEGIYSSTNRFFRSLPFALNKGEALVIRSPQIPSNAVYKKGLLLAPLGNDLFWAGPSYEWDFVDNLPSQDFLEKTTAILKLWLKVPFEVVDHVASIRPATVERRPFVGMHPHVPTVGILNGMGTKGCSLAPYFARELVEHLVNGKPLLAEVDIMRFSRILHTTT